MGKLNILFTLLLIVQPSTSFCDERKRAVQPKDYLWVCRYNVGPAGALKGSKLTKCLNYSRKVMLHYEQTKLRYKLEAKAK